VSAVRAADIGLHTAGRLADEVGHRREARRRADLQHAAAGARLDRPVLLKG